MKEYYYYERDDKGRPIVTVCLLQDESNPTTFAKGVAICNDCEAPIKKMGRVIASGRALKALALDRRNKDITTDIVEEFGSNQSKYDGRYAFICSSEFVEKYATDFEKRLLGKGVNDAKK